MNRFNIQCPCCGHMNYGLDLEETDGYMECDGCQTLMRAITYPLNANRETASVLLSAPLQNVF